MVPHFCPSFTGSYLMILEAWSFIWSTHCIGEKTLSYGVGMENLTPSCYVIILYCDGVVLF